MAEINLSSIDLNLLNVVATVLSERSATRAAARLHVTQSAVSSALRRAREVFRDPLVIREPYGLAPTPRAAALLPALETWLEEARRLITDGAAFDPATSTRLFSIACVDAMAITLLQPLLRVLRRRAPHTRLRLLTLDRLLVEDGLARGEVDLLLGMPPVLPPGHAAEHVYEDPLRCLVRADHPTVKQRLTLSQYAELPHVELALFGKVDDAVDRALAREGRARVVQVAVPHFASLPLAVLESDAVATVGLRLARAFSATLPLRVLTPPVPLAPVVIKQVWHRRTEVDAAVRFLRAAVLEAAGQTRGVSRAR